MKRVITVGNIILIALFLHSCADEAETNADDPQDATETNRDTDTAEAIDTHNSIVVEGQNRFTPGQYERKGTYGTNLLRIDSIGPSKFRFVFDWGRASCYTKMAGEAEVDENGKATFKMPGCEALDFKFMEDCISLKEYDCNFHGRECPFDGMFQLKTEPSYARHKPRALLEEIEDGSKRFDFYASFTEPFWTIYIWNDIVIFNHLDGPPDLYETNRLFDPQADEQTFFFSNADKEWKMIISKKPGSDGMSDINYPYSVLLNDQFYGGGGRQFQKEELVTD